MSPDQRKSAIEEILCREFSPEHLNVVDDSHEHAGHQSAGGLGHFSIEIQSPSFVGLSRLEAHRKIYQALGNLMETDIHALSIRIGHQ
jgi:BolA family transcriptional regulator, general stress-responsive regulator